MDHNSSIGIILWMAGISFTGFCFLAGWMWWIVGQLNRRVTYDWIEKTFRLELQNEMRNLNDILKDVRDALLGDMRTEGLISRMRRSEERCLLHRVSPHIADKADPSGDH